MSKTKKILIIVFASLFVAASISIGVLYYFYPEAILQYMHTAWEWVNKPLPIAGVSLITIGLFIIKLISVSSFGKKSIKEINEKFEEEKKTRELAEIEYNKLIENLKEELEKAKQTAEKMREITYKVTQVIPNKKVKVIGEELNGKETIDD